MSTKNTIDQDADITKSSGSEPSFITTAAGCFAVFTICYAVFNFTTDYFGIRFNKDAFYWAFFLGAYLLINIIFWRVVKKNLR